MLCVVFSHHHSIYIPHNMCTQMPIHACTSWVINSVRSTRKLTHVPDFSQILYTYSICRDMKPQQFLGAQVVWLVGNEVAKLKTPNSLMAQHNLLTTHSDVTNVHLNKI